MTQRLDADGWSARLDHLAALARFDALAIVLSSGEGQTTYAAHNLPAVAWAGTPAGAVIANTITQRTPGRLDAAGLPLADGRSARTLAAAPIVWREQAVGALVGLAAGDVADPERAALERAAGIVAIELADANVLWRAQRQAQDLDARLRAGRDLQRSLRLHDASSLLDRAVAQLAELFGADGVSIMLLDDQSRLAVRSARGLPDDAKRERRALGEGISGRVAQTGRAALLSGPVSDGSDPTASESMVVPLRAGDRTIGVVSVKHRSPQSRYGQTQLDALTFIAQDIATSYLTAFELQRAEEDRQQAIVLYELSRYATLGADPQHDLSSAAAMLAGTLRNDAVGLWQVEDDRLRLRAGVGYEAGAEVALNDADTTLATVLREKRTARTQVGASEERPDWAAAGCTQLVLAPIGGHGVLVLGRAATPYAEAEAELATTIADYLVAMLQRSSTEDVVDRGVTTERRRIAQEIHDGLAQELTGVVLALEGCQRAFEKDPALLGPQLAKAARDARATLADVRQYMSALRQSETGALNLPVTLGRLVDDLRRQTGLSVEMEESGGQRELEPIVERAVIRIVGEALRNVAQHAGASKAKVALLYGPEGVVVTIEDDGKGFDVDAAMRGAEERGHFGVVGMRERAESAGGQLVMRSEAGRGTIVRANIPYRSAGAMPPAPGPIEDVEQQPIEDHEAEVRGGFFTRIFGR